jgi:hypothetical protein
MLAAGRGWHRPTVRLDRAGFSAASTDIGQHDAELADGICRSPCALQHRPKAQPWEMYMIASSGARNDRTVASTYK